jgi:hypothetical protein
MSRLLAIAIAAGSASAASAQTTLYSNNFEYPVRGPEWSINTTFTNHANFTWFVGRYSENDSVTLTLPAPPPPTGCGGVGGGTGTGGEPGGSDSCYNLFKLTFDLYIIDSWDGYLEPHGPDSFQVFINGGKHFEETFANQHTSQSFRPPDIGPTHLGFNGLYRDSIYRDITIPFDIGESSTLTIKFQSQGLHSMIDESWGIDNVRVTYQAVPTPGSLSLLAAGLALLAPRRRR